ncbi:MAG: ribosome biogenesis factor YjgA [Pseudomonadota bacterium]
MSKFKRETDEHVSKSERKRQAHRLQALGRELTELEPAELEALPLSDALRAAVADHRRFPSKEARRRQLQFIGRLMREEDTAALQDALEALRGRSARARYEFHLLERWRDRLLEEPDALTAFLAEHPGTDTQQLRHRIQQVHKARTAEQHRTAYRALFRFLRETLHAV